MCGLDQGPQSRQHRRAAGEKRDLEPAVCEAMKGNEYLYQVT